VLQQFLHRQYFVIQANQDRLTSLVQVIFCQRIWDFPVACQRLRKISPRIVSGDLPQMAEFNTPRLMVAAGKYSAYDGFKACKIVGARLATLLHEVISVRIKGLIYLTVVRNNLPLRCVTFAL